MKIYILNLLLIFACINAFGQAQAPTGPVYFEINNENDELKSIHEWVGGGMILLTGENAFLNKNSSIHNVQLHFFTEKLGHVWSKSVDHNFAVGEEDWRVLSSNRYIYHICTPRIPGKTLESYVTQFTRYGEKKEIKLEINDIDRVWFTDDNYLYILKSGKKEEYYNLVKIKHETLETEEVILNLPQLTNYHNQFKSERWTYFGFQNETMLFYNKVINNTPPKQKCNYDVLLINTKDEVINQFKIDVELKKGVILPSNNAHTGQMPPQKNYKNKVTTKADPILASYGDIYYDKKSECIFIYGQYGPEICSNGNCEYEGVFLQKYSIEGDEYWKIKQPFPEKYIKRDPNLGKSAFDGYNTRLCHLIHDQWNEFFQVVTIPANNKVRKAYVTKFNYNGDYMTTSRGNSKAREYFKNATLIEDKHNTERYFEYDSYYEPGLLENSKGEDKFQDLINLTPGLDIALYELFSFESGEVVVERLNQRKAVVFYFVPRN